MDRRLELHQILVNILGSNNVYFQPPPSIKLKYPCIIYERSGINTIYADDKAFLHHVKYSITLIGRSPENELVKKILELPYCSYDRYFTADLLSHDTFSLYY